MSMQDPISDMFIRIKNAQAVNKEVVSMPFSNVKFNIAKVLFSEGYIRRVEVRTENQKDLLIYLKYYKNEPVIQMLKRVSLLGCRVYRSAKKLPRIMGGLGTTIVSTSAQGVVSGRVAYANGHGGEVIGLVA